MIDEEVSEAIACVTNALLPGDSTKGKEYSRAFLEELTNAGGEMTSRQVRQFRARCRVKDRSFYDALCHLKRVGLVEAERYNGRDWLYRLGNAVPRLVEQWEFVVENTNGGSKWISSSSTSVKTRSSSRVA